VDRTFNPRDHIVNVIHGELVDMFDDAGNRLPGIQGTGGSHGNSHGGLAIGVDRIVMQQGTAFPLHVHEGDHLLVILAGTGSIHVDGIDYKLTEGDSIYVPAEYPHGVGGPSDEVPFELLAFGIPHHPIDSTTRMKVVTDVVGAGVVGALQAFTHGRD